jgi:O-antigen/teichoic acid export membrane protein
MLADEMTGEYAANYKLAMFISLITQAFRYAAEPFFFKNAAMKDSNAVFARVFHYFITVCLIMFLVISSFAHEIVSFTFFGWASKPLIPKAYWAGLSIVPIVLMANVFLGAYFNLSIWFKITKQPRFGVFIAVIGAVITILLNLITIPWFGYAGSAWATLFCYFSMAAICFKLGQIYYPIPYRLERLLIYFLISLLFLQIQSSEGTNLLFRVFVNLAFVVGIYFTEKMKPLRFSVATNE